MTDKVAAESGRTGAPGGSWVALLGSLWGLAVYLALALLPGGEPVASPGVGDHSPAPGLGAGGYLSAPLHGVEEAAPAHIPVALGFSDYRAAPVPGVRDAWQRYLAEAVLPLETGDYVGAPLSRALGRWEEIECLALTIYHEARGEGEAGKRAVGDVVMNRVFDPGFPGSVCAVTRQGGERVRNRCQFSWWCDGRSDEPADDRAWRDSYEVALQVYWDRARDVTEGALWYHAEYVAPKWRKAFDKGPRIGRHLFYRRPGAETVAENELDGREGSAVAWGF